jgi:hypothetical protein
MWHRGKNPIGGSVQADFSRQPGRLSVQRKRTGEVGGVSSNCLGRHFAFLVKFDPQTAICVIKHLFFTIPIAVFTRPANVRDYWNNSNRKYAEI